MMLFGITGGIGMGKSAVGKLLEQLGLPVIDTDTIAHELVRPGQPGLAEIAGRFGRDIIGSDGALRRGELARRVFSDPQERAALEAILHPRIRAVWLKVVGGWRAKGHPSGAVVIPLLFETDAAGQFDAVICAACSAASQRERLRARGWSEAQTAARIEAQWPLEQKMRLSHYVVWTEGEMEVTRAQLVRILPVNRAEA